MKLEKMNLSNLHSLLDQAPKDQQIIIRPSGLQEFASNPLSWACKQILGVQFSNSVQTVIGTGFHAAIDAFLTGSDERKSLIGAYMAIRDNFKFIPKIKRTETVFSIYKSVKLYFLDYYLPYAKKIKNQVIDSEFKMEYPLAENILCKGTTDHIIKDEDGNYIICDIKTTKTSFGKKDIQIEGADLIKERDELERKMKLKRTKEDEKIAYQNRIDEISPEIEKFESKYNKALETEYTKQAMNKYGIQLATYAMLYEATAGIQINRARVELLIKTKTPKFEIYEFDLTEFKQHADYQLDLLIETIKIWREEKISSRVLFNYNNSTFYGEELEEILGY